MEKFWEKILELISIEKFFMWLEELIMFYFKPRTFFVNFFEKSFKDKILQIAVYISILITLGYIFIDGSSVKELTKAILFELAMLTVSIIILSISGFLNKMINKSNYSIANVVYFTIISKLLLAPFQVIFFGLFIYTENYNFFFIQNLFLLLLFLYIYFFSTRILYSTVTQIVTGIVLNLVVLNLFFYLLYGFSLDKYSTIEYIYTDQILKERATLGRKIIDPFKIPQKRILVKNEKITLTYFTIGSPLDSVTSDSFDSSDVYFHNLKSNMRLVDSSIKLTHFKRNKEFFEKLLEAYISIENLTKVEVVNYTNNDVEDFQIYFDKKDSSKTFKRIVLKVEQSYKQEIEDLINEEIEVSNMSYYSSLPVIMTSYLCPLLFLLPEYELDNSL